MRVCVGNKHRAELKGNQWTRRVWPRRGVRDVNGLVLMQVLPDTDLLKPVPLFRNLEFCLFSTKLGIGDGAVCCFNYFPRVHANIRWSLHLATCFQSTLFDLWIIFSFIITCCCFNMLELFGIWSVCEVTHGWSQSLAQWSQKCSQTEFQTNTVSSYSVFGKIFCFIGRFDDLVCDYLIALSLNVLPVFWVIMATWRYVSKKQSSDKLLVHRRLHVLQENSPL